MGTKEECPAPEESKINKVLASRGGEIEKAEEVYESASAVLSSAAEQRRCSSSSVWCRNKLSIRKQTLEKVHWRGPAPAARAQEATTREMMGCGELRAPARPILPNCGNKW